MHKNALRKLFEKYIYATPEKGIIFVEKFAIDSLGEYVINILGGKKRILGSTRMVKHLYDRKPAEEFDAILDNLPSVIKSPDAIYKNKASRRGKYCFMKIVKGSRYLASVEIVKHGRLGVEAEIVTAFRIRDDKYLRDYDLLWSWRDGAHSS